MPNRYEGSQGGSSDRGSNRERRTFTPRPENKNETREQRREPSAPPRLQVADPQLRNAEFDNRMGSPRFAPSPVEAVPTDSRPTPVSLNTLRRESSIKSPESTQNRNTLKEALSGILSEVKKSETKQPTPSSQEEIRPIETVLQTHSHAPKEIPEGILRGMLSVDEEGKG
jgi:hypothetical protein